MYVFLLLIKFFVIHPCVCVQLFIQLIAARLIDATTNWIRIIVIQRIIVDFYKIYNHYLFFSNRTESNRKSFEPNRTEPIQFLKILNRTDFGSVRFGSVRNRTDPITGPFVRTKRVMVAILTLTLRERAKPPLNWKLKV
jgi:hypothetical protein